MGGEEMSMAGSDKHPKFKSPPVEEVAVGVQFSAPGFLPTHYGAFYESMKRAFPRVEVLPPLPDIREMASPQTESASPQVPSISFGFGAQWWPRVLFVSEDDCTLIQLQSDRLFFNWRRRQAQPYEHYGFLRDGFSQAYKAFEVFATEQGFGPVVPFQCEIDYVNPLPPSATGAEPSSPEKVFRVWSSSVGEEWVKQLEDLSYNARYPLLDDTGTQIGRLTATMTSIFGPDNEKQMRLELVARGNPRGKELNDILAFHDIGHDAIVRCFAAITTPAMHVRWGRYL
jgi:uncharacterized protein (TIGR04255 family)